MDTTMFQLRTFVHQRLSAAAEEILGEVEKTITVALNEAQVCWSKEEESLRRQLDLLRQTQEEEPSLTFNTENSTDRCEASLLHEDPGKSNPEEANLSVNTKISQTGEDLDNENWSYSFNETNPKVPEIKEEEEEEEELCNESQTLEISLPFPEVVKTEEQLEEQTSNELNVVSLYCSVAQGEISNRREEFVSRDGEEAKTMEGKSLGPPSESPSADKEKGRSFCHLCGKGFQYIGSLTKHIKAHEKIDVSICGTARQSSQDPSTCVNVHHNKANVCNVCGQTFANNRCLQRHVKLHAGMKRFICQECGKAFNRREHLIVHVRTHSGEKPYHCDVCGKAFSQSQNLTIHKRSHSGEKPYHCALCGKLFNTSSHLKRHMRYHSGEKPYTCDICGKGFHQSGQMTRHRTTHTGEKPYACQVCGIRYRFAPNLKAHLQTHLFRQTENRQTITQLQHDQQIHHSS